MKIFKIIQERGSLWIMMCIIVILSFILFYQCDRNSNLNDKLRIKTQNEFTLKDSIRTYETQNGDLVYEKGILIANQKELKELNFDLSKELKELKDNPITITKIHTEIVHDTLSIIKNELIVYDNGIYGLEWEIDTTYSKGNYRKLKGISKFQLKDSSIISPLKTNIKEDKIGFSLITGITEKKNIFEIYVKSKYPGFELVELDGSIIDKKRFLKNDPSWTIGPNVGYGIVFSKNGKIYYGWTAGFSIQYNLTKPIKKLFK